MARASRSQFIEKLHALLENPLDPDSLRWVSDDAFEITCHDGRARHALSPGWDFRSLSSFIRQLSYYNFKRLSDRRRSSERRATTTGYIVFSHPSGFFARGDPSKLHGIVRKKRDRSDHAAARRASTSSVHSSTRDDDDDDGSPPPPPPVPVPAWPPPPSSTATVVGGGDTARPPYINVSLGQQHYQDDDRRPLHSLPLFSASSSSTPSPAFHTAFPSLLRPGQSSSPHDSATSTSTSMSSSASLSCWRPLTPTTTWPTTAAAEDDTDILLHHHHHHRRPSDFAALSPRSKRGDLVLPLPYPPALPVPVPRKASLSSHSSHDAGGSSGDDAYQPSPYHPHHQPTVFASSQPHHHLSSSMSKYESHAGSGSGEGVPSGLAVPYSPHLQSHSHHHHPRQQQQQHSYPTPGHSGQSLLPSLLNPVGDAHNHTYHHRDDEDDEDDEDEDRRASSFSASSSIASLHQPHLLPSLAAAHHSSLPYFQPSPPAGGTWAAAPLRSAPVNDHY